MSIRWHHWGMAGMASVAAHAGLAAFLIRSTEPGEMPEQPESPPGIDIGTEPVRQSRAEARDAESEAARESDSAGAGLAGTSLPMSDAVPARPDPGRAEPVSAPGARLRANPPEGMQVAAADPPPTQGAIRPETATPLQPAENQPVVMAAAPVPQPEAAAAVSELGGTQITAAVATAPPTAKVTPELQRAQTVLPDTAPIAQAVVTAQDTAPAAALPAVPAQTSADVSVKTAGLAPDAPDAEAVAAPTQATQSEPASALAQRPDSFEPDAEYVVAALAWSGGEDSAVDETSLSAIQAFMPQAKSLGPGSAAQQVRDAISSALDAVSCSRLQTVFEPATGRLELRGHLPDDTVRPNLIAQLQASVGTSIPVEDKLRVLPAPQCESLAGISAVGLPQSTEQLTNPLIIGDDAYAQEYLFHDGDRLFLEMQAPDYQSFVYVDYFDADGGVIHLQPNDLVGLRSYAPEETVRIGGKTASGPGIDIRFAPPFGQEIAVAFAASEPLYDEARPIREDAAPYLRFMQEKVAEARVRDPDFKGEWVYFFVMTRP